MTPNVCMCGCVHKHTDTHIHRTEIKSPTALRGSASIEYHALQQTYLCPFPPLNEDSDSQTFCFVFIQPTLLLWFLLWVLREHYLSR